MVLHKYNTIFIHIPKTAGGSMELALLKLYFNKALPHHRLGAMDKERRAVYLNPSTQEWMQHWSIEDIVNSGLIPQEIADQYFKFAFVRNPWDRAVSEFLYVHKMKGCHCEDSFKSEYPSFKQFISGNGWKCCWSGHEKCQLDFILNNGQPIDFIGRFENLQNDFDYVCERIGVDKIKLPVVNRFHKNRVKKHYTSYYEDKETIEMVTEKYIKDIEYFGYEFGDKP